MRKILISKENEFSYKEINTTTRTGISNFSKTYKKNIDKLVSSSKITIITNIKKTNSKY